MIRRRHRRIALVIALLFLLSFALYLLGGSTLYRRTAAPDGRGVVELYTPGAVAGVADTRLRNTGRRALYRAGWHGDRIERAHRTFGQWPALLGCRWRLDRQYGRV